MAMATILLTWELGAGLGHLVNLLPLARGLLQRGHRVYAAGSKRGRS
jgi:UDP:flavonoid glycosyltransferase YjiC (YdhE family)